MLLLLTTQMVPPDGQVLRELGNLYRIWVWGTYANIGGAGQVQVWRRPEKSPAAWCTGSGGEVDVQGGSWSLQWRPLWGIFRPALGRWLETIARQLCKARSQEDELDPGAFWAPLHLSLCLTAVTF